MRRRHPVRKHSRWQCPKCGYYSYSPQYAAPPIDRLMLHCSTCQHDWYEFPNDYVPQKPIGRRHTWLDQLLDFVGI